MGRLPKGFSAKKRGKDEVTEAAALGDQKPAPSESTSQQQQISSATSKEDTEEAPPASKFLRDVEGSGDNEETGPETRGQVVQRHKREMQAFKKSLQRMGKKSKDEVAALTSEIEDRHKRELHEVEQRENQAGESAQAISRLRLGDETAAAQEFNPGGLGEEQGAAIPKGGVGPKATKAMKRREKAQREEAEREARIAEEAAAAGPSARALEEEALGQLLAPLGLRMREIKADGHCLYRSLEDQLHLAARKHAASQASSSGGGPEPLQYQQLREAAAAHIRAHAEDYLPYIPEEDQAAGDHPDGISPLERYCSELESTACWGGQLELSVLAQVLKRPIEVYAAGLPTVTLGEDFKAQAAPLQVCYLRHAFGLGEHYNSLGTLEVDAPC